MKLDILAIASHPDDVELGCGGTILRHISLGYKVGIVDLTRGELGTRGTPQQREAEAIEAARILGVSVRENLGLRDGFFQNSEADQLKIVEAIRHYQPEVVLANAVYDRHPDHGRGAELISTASFLAGLAKVQTSRDGKVQLPWRPKVIYHFIQSQLLQPDVVVDISEFWEKKMEAIRAFKTQFYDPGSQEPETYISKPGFLKMLESRAFEFGHGIGVQYGEGFTVQRVPGVKNLFDLI